MVWRRWQFDVRHLPNLPRFDDPFTSGTANLNFMNLA
jgi:hypothetical protein